MDKYRVTVKENFGDIDVYDVEANSEHEAKEEALGLAADDAVFMPMYLTRQQRKSYFSVISCIKI